MKSNNLPVVAAATLVMWGLILIGFSTPEVVSAGRLPAWVPVWSAATLGPGLTLSALLYLATRRTEAWSPTARFAGLAIAVGAASAIQGVSCNFLMVAVQRAFGLDHPEYLQPAALTFSGFAYLWIYTSYAAGLVWFSADRRARAHEQQAVEALAQARQARLDLLRFQLSPHFLFNTLNNLSSLVMTDRKKEAERVIAHLSDFLRATLTAGDERMTPLRDELATVAAFLEIEAVRYPQPMAVSVECEPQAMDALIPGLLLQPLVENAVKYAVRPARGRASIVIDGRRDGDALIVSIRDSGAPVRLADTEPGSGIGLNNVRQRLEVLFGSAASLTAERDGHGFLAVVRLPWSSEGDVASELAPVALAS